MNAHPKKKPWDVHWKIHLRFQFSSDYLPLESNMLCKRHLHCFEPSAPTMSVKTVTEHFLGFNVLFVKVRAHELGVNYCLHGIKSCAARSKIITNLLLSYTSSFFQAFKIKVPRHKKAPSKWRAALLKRWKYYNPRARSTIFIVQAFSFW